MGRNYGIKNKALIENKPYLSKRELVLLLEKEGKNLDKKITQLIKSGYLIPLKKGLYTTQTYALINKGELLPEYLANRIYYPSYLSTEYVLSKTGVLPEGIYVYTSVSLKTTRRFNNRLGAFSYQKIKELLFTGYSRKSFTENYQIKIASKAKALFDYLYFRPFQTYSKSLADLRINWVNITKADLQEFQKYTRLSQSSKMNQTYQLIKKAYADR